MFNHLGITVLLLWIFVRLLVAILPMLVVVDTSSPHTGAPAAAAGPSRPRRRRSSSGNLLGGLRTAVSSGGGMNGGMSGGMSEGMSGGMVPVAGVVHEQVGLGYSSVDMDAHVYLLLSLEAGLYAPPSGGWGEGGEGAR